MSGRHNPLPHGPSLLTATRVSPLVPLLLGTVAGSLNNNIVNVPLRKIMAGLRVPLSRGALVVISFNLSLAVIMPIAGWMADRFGRKRVFVSALLMMAGASCAAAVAPNIGVLVALRVVQGSTGAAILPCVMGLITDIYGVERRGRALGLWAAANGLGQTIGPALGGVLSSWLSWRVIFLPSVPLSVLGALAAHWLVPRAAARKASLDWRGAALLSLGVGSVITAAILVPDLGVASAAVLASGIGGLIAIFGFLRWTQKRPGPFLDPRLVREPSYLRSALAVFAQMFCLGATLLAVPLALTRGGHRSTAEVGVIVFVLPATMTMLAPVAAIATERFGPRTLLRFGMVLLVAAEIGLAILPGTMGAVAGLFAGLVLAGIGTAFVQTPAATGATRSPAGRVGTALGMFNLVRFAGSALGGAWAAIALSGAAADAVVFDGCAVIALLGLACTWASPEFPYFSRGTPTIAPQADGPGPAPS